ncbi:Peptidase aspartic [Cordyceps fumosorosea ARSEF 2679]|uniref:Peptidase aspartic n=1 Tax=Cordyceps fumosorosea (strain ARSEF 2679) TaxID=1081104 RepID=A0A167M2X7_CORFA|nr:Peptidase aspartic [Cordyceps fumosorosea ARSEF 2679]OAA53844.1 Peptidase aspartic [Cordyceps fumosorosea ARSEF 2679]
MPVPFDTRTNDSYKLLAIPATSAKLGNPFLRAYPPELEGHGISVLGLAGNIVSFVPLPTAQIVGSAAKYAGTVSTVAVSKGRSEMLLNGANSTFFKAAGLKAQVAQLDVVARLANIPILDSEGKVDRGSSIMLPFEEQQELHTMNAQHRRVQALSPWLSPLDMGPLPELDESTNDLGKMHAKVSERQRQEEKTKMVKDQKKMYKGYTKDMAKENTEYEEKIEQYAMKESRIQEKGGRRMEKELRELEKKREKLTREHNQEVSKIEKDRRKDDKEEENDADGMDVQVGTPPQKVTLLVDTGSSTYPVESPHDIYCQEGMCEETGTFDNQTSRTANFVDNNFSNVVSNQGHRSVLRDILSIGGYSFENMKFGYILGHYCNTSHPLAALTGLSLFCVDKYCNAARSFTQALYERGYIEKCTYSVFLGPGDGSVPPHLVMGGIDWAKRQGRVYHLKLVNPLKEKGGGVLGKVVTWGLSLSKAGEPNVDFTYQGDDKEVLWDTGSARWYAPEPIFWKVTEYFGLPSTIDGFAGRYAVDCKYRTPNEDVLVVILDGGHELPIPMWQLLHIPIDDILIRTPTRTAANGN